MLKNMAFYRFLEEYQETGCLWGEKLGLWAHGERKTESLLFQPGETVVSALKYTMTFCTQPFVNVTVYLLS